MLLETIDGPADLRQLSQEQLVVLASEIRDFIVQAVSVTGGHLGSNLGVVELTLALHRVFDSPRDIILWDTGHQAYVHKIVTGRRAEFANLRQQGGLSGYPNRAESEHDWIENSHASTVLSYAHGLACAAEAGPVERKVIAVIGDGSMTGGMAFEALNNLGHSGKRCIIILNDNGRSYAPTVSKLSDNISRLRLHPGLKRQRTRLEHAIRELPAVGELAYSSLQGVYAAVREVFEPFAFFETLGVRYTGPIDGHDIAGVEAALRHAAAFDGPIVVHVLTQKGKGYPPAEDDDEKCLHDAPVFDPLTGPPAGWARPRGYTEAFSQTLIELAQREPRLRAITAAMPGPTGLLPFQERFPDRFTDVGIAEQHAATMAAGMAMGGLRPVVAVYSTFFARSFDQANLDVGLHNLPVIFALDRAGITGDDGPSHHGVLDLSLCLNIPNMTIFAPSSVQEVRVMLTDALEVEGPVAIRWPKGAARHVPDDQVGGGLSARLVRGSLSDDPADVCLLAVGKMVEAAEEAADKLAAEGLSATVWDVRLVRPLDAVMIADAARHPLVVTIEDGIRLGGAGSAMVDAIAGVDGGRHAPPVLILGTPLRYIPQGKPDQIHAQLGLDGPGIASSVLAARAECSG
ncbi:MAG TPA: 1-deoxy-D-xylulose-5-phosphate synthase [Acidimicrobiales bacterium]|nr:1-deoxy-D-xylulose-5-phosphate synthase [Acidimicrobiales bacterium]